MATMSATGNVGGAPAPTGPIFKAATGQVNTTSPQNVTLPPGALAGDFVVLSYGANYSFGGANSIVGGRFVDQQDTGAMYAKILDATDISNGYVTVTTFNADSPRGYIAIALFSGVDSQTESAFVASTPSYGTPATMPVPAGASSLCVIAGTQYSSDANLTISTVGTPFVRAHIGADYGSNDSSAAIFYAVNDTGLALPNQTFAGTSDFSISVCIAAEFPGVTP